MYTFSIRWSLYIRLDISLYIYVSWIIIYCVTSRIIGNFWGKNSGLFHARRLGIKMIFLIQRYTIMQRYLFTSCLALFPSLRQLKCLNANLSASSQVLVQDEFPSVQLLWLCCTSLNSCPSPRHVQFRHCPSSPRSVSSMFGLYHTFQLLFFWKTALYQDNQWKWTEDQRINNASLKMRKFGSFSFKYIVS